MGGITIFQVTRVKPSRLHRLFDIYIDDIISGCSSNFGRKSHQRELFETSYGTFVLANLFNHPISITFNQFLTLISSFLRKVHLFGDQMATHSDAPTIASCSIVIVRPDLLLATKSVVIALDSVDKSSFIISIEFTIYLRSMSSP